MRWAWAVAVFFIVGGIVAVAIDTIFWLLDSLNLIKAPDSSDLKYVISCAIAPFASTYLGGRTAPKHNVIFAIVCNLVEAALAFAFIGFIRSRIQMPESDPKYMIITVVSIVVGCLAVFIYESNGKSARKSGRSRKSRTTSKKKSKK